MRGNLLIFCLFIPGDFVPFKIVMVPVSELILSLGLYNTKLGLILFHIALQTGFCMVSMCNFIRALPHDLIGVARVDDVQV
jgi:multiple sugar transport system permease protein